MSEKRKSIIYACVAIPSAVVTGSISGISSVIASYFFRPVWNKIVTLWEKQKTNNE
jgi:hypothetical protein